jgi:hypothetical protein
MKLVSEQIQEYVINHLDNSLKAVEVGAFDDVNFTQSVTFCDAKWLRLYLDRLLINGVPTKVVQIVSEVEFIVETDVELTVLEIYSLPKPLLLNGTLSNTKWEWNKYVDPTTKQNKERDKLPFIWLVSPTEEKTDNYNAGGSKTVIAKLWFVHWSDWKKLNVDRQDEAIKPLYALLNEFMATMNRLSNIFDGDSLNYATRDFPKFGTENENGIDKALFDSTLSAIELDVNFKMIKRYCENC